MANIINYTNFVIEEALNAAIENFEKNVKGEYVCITERGIKIKILNKSTTKYTQYNVVPKTSKVSFENLNGSAVINFNHITKDNAKFALVYYKQIASLRHVQSIIKKMDPLDMKKKYLASTDNLIENKEYSHEN